MAKTFLAFASFAALPSFAAAEDREAIGIPDRDHVRFVNIARIFRFTQYTSIVRTVSGENPPAPAAPIQQPGTAIHCFA
jgi:hypothetical protein